MSPLQGLRLRRIAESQGVALGYRITPLQGLRGRLRSAAFSPRSVACVPA